MAKTRKSPLQRGLALMLSVLMLTSMFSFGAWAATSDITVDLSQDDVVVTVNADGSATVTGKDSLGGTIADGNLNADGILTITGDGETAAKKVTVNYANAAAITAAKAVNIKFDGAIADDVTANANVNVTVADGTLATAANVESDVVVTVGAYDSTGGSTPDTDAVVNATVSAGDLWVDGDVAVATVEGGVLLASDGSGALYTVGKLDAKDGIILANLKEATVSGGDFAGCTIEPAYEDKIVDASGAKLKLYTNVAFKAGNKMIVTDDKGVSVERSYNITAVDTDNLTLDVFAPANVAVTFAESKDKAVVAPTGVTATDASSKNDGVITGVDATMEYMVVGDTAWTDVVADKIENLAAGTYFVRTKAVEETDPMSATTVKSTAGVPAIVVVPVRKAAADLTVTVTPATIPVVGGGVKIAVTNTTDYAVGSVFALFAENGQKIGADVTLVAAGTVEFDVTSEGKYYVTVDELNGAYAKSAVQEIKKDDAVKTIDAPVILVDTAEETSKEADFAGNIGVAETVALTVKDTDGAATYTWYLDGKLVDTAATYTANKPGDYTVKVEKDGLKAESVAVTLTQKNSLERPTVTATPDTQVLTGTPAKVDLNAVSKYTGTGAQMDGVDVTGVTYQWYTIDGAVATGTNTNATYEADAIGVYYVVVSVTAGANTKTVTSAPIEVYAAALAAPAVTPAGPVNLKFDGSETLTVAGDENGYWMMGDTKLQHTATTLVVTQPGEYKYVNVRDGVEEASNVVIITKDGVLTAAVTASAKSASNAKITLTAKVGDKTLALTDFTFAPGKDSIVWTKEDVVIASAADNLSFTADGYATYKAVVTYNGQTASAEVKTQRSGGTSGPSGSVNTEDKKVTYTLTFETNGGSAIEAKKIEKDTEVTLSDYKTTKAGYVLSGWFSDKELTTAVTTLKMTKDTTVYAKWSEASSLLDTTTHGAYLTGYADGTVKPNATITRAETAAILYRSLTEAARTDNKTSDNSFSDVSASSWYNTEVSTMSKMEVIKGYANGSFGGEKNITRAEFATMISRLTNDVTGTASVNLSDISGHWAEASIKKVAACGWVTGYTDGSFKPDASITRAEAVTMLNRVLGMEGAARTGDDVKTFSDCKSGEWFYDAVMNAANGAAKAEVKTETEAK